MAGKHHCTKVPPHTFEGVVTLHSAAGYLSPKATFEIKISEQILLINNFLSEQILLINNFQISFILLIRYLIIDHVINNQISSNEMNGDFF